MYYGARRSRLDAETRRYSLRREPVAAVMGAPLAAVLVVTALRILLGFTRTFAELGA